MDDFIHSLKPVFDIAAVLTGIGVIMTTLVPWLAALASLVWSCLRIYEMLTGKPIAKRKLNEEEPQ